MNKLQRTSLTWLKAPESQAGASVTCGMQQGLRISSQIHAIPPPHRPRSPAAAPRVLPQANGGEPGVTDPTAKQRGRETPVHATNDPAGRRGRLGVRVSPSILRQHPATRRDMGVPKARP